MAKIGSDKTLDIDRFQGEESRAEWFQAQEDERQRKDALDNFEKHIAEYEEVMECYLMTGDADYLLRVIVPEVVGEARRGIHLATDGDLAAVAVPMEMGIRAWAEGRRVPLVAPPRHSITMRRGELDAAREECSWHGQMLRATSCKLPATRHSAWRTQGGPRQFGAPWLAPQTPVQN